MTLALPSSAHAFMDAAWPDIEPHYQQLKAITLTAENVEAWLDDWTALSDMLAEASSRLSVANTQDTADEAAEKRLTDFLENVSPKIQTEEQALKQMLLDSGLEPAGFEMPLKRMRTDAALFREENLPLLVETRTTSLEYRKLVGAHVLEWQGEELTSTQLAPRVVDADRQTRQKAWMLQSDSALEDRPAMNDLWAKLLDLRVRTAANAGYDNYRDYRWQEFHRFDYTPDDCKRFHDAIEKTVVPAAKRVYEAQREALGVDSLRPWDISTDAYRATDIMVNPPGLPELKPYDTLDELMATTEAIFQQADPELGKYFGIMRQEELLDLGNRKGKAPGGYCTSWDHVKRPFIFMNAVGLHRDVQTLLHEAGHAFHVFEIGNLRYHQQADYPIEFAEVASMAMELLAAPYLSADAGGFYTAQEAAVARIEHLKSNLLFWPYMAVVDAFQHWVYENPDDALDSANCDAKWVELWDRFIQGQDWSGLDEHKADGWHRKLHIYMIPFYYVEYGLAQLGAMQVWRNSLDDQAQALKDYRAALSLGGTAPLPDLYAAAGAKLAFDADTLGGVVKLAEDTIAELSAV